MVAPFWATGRPNPCTATKFLIGLGKCEVPSITLAPDLCFLNLLSAFCNPCLPQAGEFRNFALSISFAWIHPIRYALPVLRSRRNCVGGCALLYGRANFFMEIPYPATLRHLSNVLRSSTLLAPNLYSMKVEGNKY
jgi:hypothetical protein